MNGAHEDIGCRFVRGLCMVVCGGLMAVSASAGVKTWQTAGPGDWFTSANWVGNAIPEDGDEVMITNTSASVILSNATPALSSLTLSRTLVFTNWNSALNATNVLVQSGGNMTLPLAFSTNAMSNNVYIVCSNFTLDAAGTINVNGKGYVGGPAGNVGGQGPGRGAGGGQGAGGGGYGGNGGYGNGWTAGGVTYGLTNAPILPGSGGGYAVDTAGGAGGGAVRIEATGRVIVNGTITANGADAYSRGGGGSGGGIFITCDVFGGTASGVISAKGGNSGTGFGGGGGGGRIAVIYGAAQSSEPKPRVSFLLDGGTGWSSHYSSPGTLYFTDFAAFDETWMPTTGVLHSPASSFTADSLVIGRGRLLFTTPGVSLTVANALTITGSVARLEMPVNGVINCGSLGLTNGGSLYVCATVTNGAYGSLVSAAGDVAIASNSWIYLTLDTSTNGASARFTMNNLTIASFGGINADGAGYAGGPFASTRGSGPGGGYTGGQGGGGGGYGGAGSAGNGGGAGPIYGSTNAPVAPGSGGAWAMDAPGVGGRGGGAVQIAAAGKVTLHGIITANGVTTVGRGGGGSGGGIYITCKKLEGSTNAVLRANGGSAQTLYGGGGGGGRIAIQTKGDAVTAEAPGTYIAYAGSTNGCLKVTKGTGYGTSVNGTFYLQILPPSGTEIRIQ